MKRLIIRLSLFCPIILIIIILNLKVDPARLFQTKDYEKNIANALISGKAVTDLKNSNFDDRAMNRFLIQSLKKKKDIAVFGSSRVMLISSEMLRGQTILNNGLSSATLEDFICLYEIYKESRVLPSMVIIGVDPWDFNKNNGRVGWQQFGQYYSKYMRSKPGHSFELKLRPQDFVPYTWQQLISLSYFQDSIQFLFSSKFHLASSQGGFTITTRKKNEGETILPDGSRTLSKKDDEISATQVREKIKQKNAINEELNMFGFVELNKDLKEKFVSLIRSMQNDRIKVVLYLPPYHPLTYDYYVHSDQFKIIMDVESFLRKASVDYGLTVVGSYNPHLFSIPETSFMDDVHLKDEAILKTFFLNLVK